MSARAVIHAEVGEQTLATGRPAAPTPSVHGAPGSAAQLLRLQRSHGNRFVRRALAGGSGGGLAPSVEGAIEAARGGGRPLESRPRGQMESAFGADLSGVRVHTGETASVLSSALDARAFTVGSDVFFARGQYDPDSSGGRRLIAHELTHVLQQSGERHTKLTVGEPDDPYERQAEEVAEAVAELEQVSDRERGPAQTGQLLRTETVGRVLAVQRQQWTTGARVGTGALVGAGIGAGIGALIGSVVPVIGTAIGAGVGAGIGGLIGGIVGYFRGLRVSFSRVRAASTPAEMGPDRIPPRVNTAVTVSIAGYDPAGAPITIGIAGNGGGNGTATVNGGPTHNMVAGGVIQLSAANGGAQTAPGNAGNLRLEARQGTRLHATSNAFSISAIPQNWSVAFQNYIDPAQPGNQCGIEVQNSWQSDSGDVADLDQAQRSESVEPKTASGIFGMGAGHVSGYLAATGGVRVDRHWTGVNVITGPGQRSVQQTFKFRDARTGVNDVPARNSGFRITRVATAGGAGPNGFQFATSKVPFGGTARGITSTPGAGGANPGPQDL